MTENLSNSDRIPQRVFEPYVLVSFYILMIYDHLLTSEKKFSFLVRRFEGIRYVLELELLVRFCILMIYKHLPTYNENFESRAHNVKIGLFLSEYLKGSDWSWNSNVWSVFGF